MKKIIALAVASAFVAPVYAADVTVSGDFEYKMVMPDGGDNSLEGGDQVITFTASSETDNGYTVSGTMNILTNGSSESVGAGDEANADSDNTVTDSDGGENIKVAGPFGSIAVGDVSSGLDNVGDYTDVAENDGGFTGDGSDSSILYVLPAFVEGLKVSISHAPDGDNFGGSSAADSYSVAYSFAGGEVYYGAFEPATGDETTAFGAKYSVGGLMIAAESGEKGTDEYQGIAATYSMGNTKLIVERQEDTGPTGDDAKDDTLFGITQSLGGGLSVYAQITQDDVSANDDKSYLGVEYSF